MAKDLTPFAVKSAKARPPSGKPDQPPVRTEYPDGHTRGLFLIVQPSGTKTWALRFRFNDKPRKLTIGPALAERVGKVDDLPLGAPHTLAEARTAAERARIEIARGADPTAKAAKTETMTVRQAVVCFIDQHCKDNRSWGETQRQFSAYVLPVIGDRPLSDITGDDLRKLVRDLDAHTMANRLHATLAKWMRWCADRERKLVQVNPYEGFEKPYDEKSRERVLHDDELAALWRCAKNEAGHFGAILRLLILTGQRRSEVTGLVRRELDYKRAEWSIPPERAKNGNRSVVPLSAAALAEIATFESADRDTLLFSTNGRTPFSGHQKCKNRIDLHLQFAEPWRLHDIRRTVATGLARLHVPQEVTEAILNHASGKVSGVASVYNQHDYANEKRAALTVWAHHIDWIVDDALQAAMDARLAQQTSRRADAIRAAHESALRGSDDRWRRYLAIWRNRYVRAAA